MKNNVILLVLFLLGQNHIISSQDTFIKKIDKDMTTLGYQVEEYEGRVFILTAKVCNNISECSTVLEIDEYGNVLWDKELPFLDVSANSMVIENDTIFLSGNYNQTQEKFLFHQMSIDGGDSLATYDVVKPDDIYTNMFNLGMLRRDDKFYIYGPGEKNNGALETSLIYVVDSKGNLDTLLTLFTTDSSSDPWQMREDNQGNVVAFIELDPAWSGEGKDSFRKIVKINNEYDIIWSYTSEEDINNYSHPRGCILDDDRIVYVTGNETFNRNIHSLRALNPDSTISWQYYPPYHASNHRKVFKLNKASDGNMIGLGEWGFKIWDPKIDQAPWIFKMSTEGELLWEHVYYELEEGQALAKTGLFFDAVELDDGSIIAVGAIRSENKDILIARFDSEGCLMFDCWILNDVTDVLSDVDDVEIAVEVSVYPNPSMAEDYITIGMDASIYESGAYQIEVFDGMGRLMISEGIKGMEHQVYMDGYENGMYYLHVLHEGKIVFSEKVIRL